MMLFLTIMELCSINQYSLSLYKLGHNVPRVSRKKENTLREQNILYIIYILIFECTAPLK